MSCRVRNKIMHVLSLRTVSALTCVLFWCLFPSLLRNSGNKPQNNPLVSAETVRHSSTYIILYVLLHKLQYLPTSSSVDTFLQSVNGGAATDSKHIMKSWLHNVMFADNSCRLIQHDTKYIKIRSTVAFQNAVEINFQAHRVATGLQLAQFKACHQQDSWVIIHFINVGFTTITLWLRSTIRSVHIKATNDTLVDKFKTQHMRGNHIEQTLDSQD